MSAFAYCFTIALLGSLLVGNYYFFMRVWNKAIRIHKDSIDLMKKREALLFHRLLYAVDKEHKIPPTESFPVDNEFSPGVFPGLTPSQEKEIEENEE